MILISNAKLINHNVNLQWSADNLFDTSIYYRYFEIDQRGNKIF